MKSWLVYFWLGLMGIAILGAAENEKIEVNVVTDLTEAGEKQPPASLEKPIYFFPLIGGYHERGGLVANLPRPQSEPLIKALLKALDERGYKLVTDRSHSPSLLLIFHWGHVNPDSAVAMDEADGIDTLDKNEMMALVAGKRMNAFRLPYEDVDIVSAANDSRYYVMVLAFDFEAAKKHEHKLLWSAKFSVPSIGISADDAMISLVRAGGPYFGHQTDRAQHVVVPVGHIGRVEAGPTEVKEMFDAKSEPSPNAKSSK